MHGARPNRAARFDATSATPSSTSCFGLALAQLELVLEAVGQPQREARVGARRADAAPCAHGRPHQLGRAVRASRSPGRRRCMAGRTWSASAMGTKVGCVMRGRLAEGVGRTYSTPARARRLHSGTTCKATEEGRSRVVEDLLVGRAQVGAVASGSPVPALRPKRGWAPLETCRRIRWPARNVLAVGHMAMSSLADAVVVPAPPSRASAGRCRR